MVDFRKILVSLVIAILFSILVHTTINAFVPMPEYSAECKEALGYYDYPKEPHTGAFEDTAELREQRRQCDLTWRELSEKREFATFVISAIAGVTAIVAGLFISASTQLGMSIASGFILGGIITLFVGTMGGWGGIGLKVRPIVILVELIIVILIAYMRLGKDTRVTAKARKR